MTQPMSALDAVPPAERGMRLDASGLEVLARAECLDLLRRQPLGRVVFTTAALPAVLPVNYLLDDDGSILLRTGARTRLAAAAGDVVAFEADHFDACGGAPSWSVVATGRLSVARDPADRIRADALGLHSWAPADRDLLLRIVPEMLSGRRLPAGAVPSGAGGRAG